LDDEYFIVKGEWMFNPDIAYRSTAEAGKLDEYSVRLPF
jgi:hypothetical protein